MYSAVSDPQLWERWREARRLVLVEAFEDSATGARIKEFRHDLFQQLGDRCQIVEHVWLCNMFRLHELQEIAAEEAAAADLVVIAVHNADSLPDEVKGWMDLWVGQAQTQRPMLLALLESAPQKAGGPIGLYLQEAARRGGMELLVEARSIAG